MTAPYVYNGELRRIGECPTPWPSVVLTISKAALDRIGDLSGMYRALQKAIKYIQQLPDPAQKIASVYDLKIEDARDWYARIQWATNETLSEKDFEFTAQALMEAGILKDVPEYNSVCASN